MEIKFKDIRNKLLEDVSSAKDQIKELEKNKKAKEKENFDLTRNLNSARENLRNLKSEKSSLKTCKTKLENENRKLEKKLLVSRTENREKMDDKNQKVKINEVDRNLNTFNPSTFSSISGTTSTSVRPFSPSTSMVTHFIPFYSTQLHSSGSITSMISHHGSSPYKKSEQEKLVTKEEFMALWAELREQIKADRIKIMEEIKQDKFWSNL